jgi:flagellar hook-basal body complex protein FliE
VNEISALPSLNDLLTQNPNLRPNSQAERFAQNFENRSSGIGSANNVGMPVQLDRSAPVDRVTAPGFAQMFEKFIQGVDQKKKISKKETQDLILGRSDNIHEAVVKSQEAGVAFNLMIEVRNKLVDSYKELMRMQV